MMCWPVAKEISLKYISLFALVACCSAELNILINFGRRHHEEHLCEFGPVVQEEMSFKGISCQ